MAHTHQRTHTQEVTALVVQILLWPDAGRDRVRELRYLESQGGLRRPLSVSAAGLAPRVQAAWGLVWKVSVGRCEDGGRPGQARQKKAVTLVALLFRLGSYHTPCPDLCPATLWAVRMGPVCLGPRPCFCAVRGHC